VGAKKAPKGKGWGFESRDAGPKRTVAIVKEVDKRLIRVGMKGRQRPKATGGRGEWFGGVGGNVGGGSRTKVEGESEMKRDNG